jgi:multicomponent K+:H+ antiporter subunit G
MPAWLDAAIATLLVLGAVFALIGSYGLLKLSDFFKRLHGPTKATTLGVGCMLIASMAYFSFAESRPVLQELLITIFLFVTAPVSAHMLLKAALKLKPDLLPPREEKRG